MADLNTKRQWAETSRILTSFNHAEDKEHLGLLTDSDLQEETTSRSQQAKRVLKNLLREVVITKWEEDKYDHKSGWLAVEQARSATFKRSVKILSLKSYESVPGRGKNCNGRG